MENKHFGGNPWISAGIYPGGGPEKFESGVVPANQTEESEVRELSGKESGTSPGTPFCL